jgi:hypothetical protein
VCLLIEVPGTLVLVELFVCIDDRHADHLLPPRGVSRVRFSLTFQG